MTGSMRNRVARALPPAKVCAIQDRSEGSPLEEKEKRDYVETAAIGCPGAKLPLG